MAEKSGTKGMKAPTGNHLDGKKTKSLRGERMNALGNRKGRTKPRAPTGR